MQAGRAAPEEGKAGAQGPGKGCSGGEGVSAHGRAVAGAKQAQRQARLWIQM